MKKNHFEAYEQFEDQSNFEGVAKSLILDADQKGCLVESDERRVQKALKNDLESSMSSQLLALIGAVAGALEAADKKIEE